MTRCMRLCVQKQLPSDSVVAGGKNGRLQVQKESKIKNTDTGRCTDSTKCGRSV